MASIVILFYITLTFFIFGKILSTQIIFYSTNITGTIEQGIFLGVLYWIGLKNSQIFLANIVILFYTMWHSLIRQLACCQVIQQLASEWTVCVIFSVTSEMLETNSQALLFNFGEDLIYFVILRYKLRDFIKIYDDYVNDPMKGDEDCYYFISARKVSWNISGFGCMHRVKAC